MVAYFNVKIRGLSRGFSLIELLVVLLIISLSATAAVSYFGGLLQQKRADDVVTTLAGLLNRARVYSMEYGEQVVVCGVDVKLIKSSNTSDCRNDWTKGIVVFVDVNGDRKLSAADQLVESRDLVGDIAGVRILKNQGLSAFFSYRTNGLLGQSAASVFYCPNTADIQYRRSVILNNVGRVRIEKGAQINSSTQLCG